VDFDNAIEFVGKRWAGETKLSFKNSLFSRGCITAFSYKPLKNSYLFGIYSLKEISFIYSDSHYEKVFTQKTVLVGIMMAISLFLMSSAHNAWQIGKT
jgi:hypothetical protein